MSKVDLIGESQAPLLAKPFYANGSPGPIGESLAHVPELMEVALPFISISLGASSLADFRTKELAIVRASAVQRCRYCTLTHMAIALDAEISPEEMRVLRDGDADQIRETFDERESALLDWTDAMSLGAGDVPEEVHARFAEHFTQPQIVELSMTVGTTLMLNRYCTALELPVSAANLAKLEDAGLS